MVKKSGLTLIEVLTVMAIIAVICAAMFPVFASAKKRALMTTSESNLHQCSLSLGMYLGELTPMDGLPDRGTAWNVLGGAITRDPADTWRKGSEASPYEAMVGSYG